MGRQNVSQVWAHGNFPAGPVAKTPSPNAGGLGLIPSQGTRSHMPQLRIRTLQLKDPASHNQRSQVLQLRPNAAKCINIKIKKKTLQLKQSTEATSSFYL